MRLEIKNGDRYVHCPDGRVYKLPNWTDLEGRKKGEVRFTIDGKYYYAKESHRI